MKRILIIMCSLFICGADLTAATKLLPEDKELYIKYVKQYCELLKNFSCNMENVTMMDSIVARCENSKVQTFNDLTAEYSKSNIEYNSVPLFQYLQNITTIYDNELEMSFSDFKCERTVTESSVGNEPMRTSYAVVHVLKKIKGKNLDVTMPMKITINTSNLKIGGTISEKYEDPHSIYLRGLEFNEDGKTDRARKCFEQCTTYRTYSGRYRAMTMIGMSYIKEQRWKEAVETLTKAAENDPVGGIMLANLLIGFDNMPIELHNYPKALLLLEKYANVRDKDFPITQAVAKYALGYIYMVGNVIPADKKKAEEYFQEAGKLAYVEKEYGLYWSCEVTKWVMLWDENHDSKVLTDLISLEASISSLVTTKEMQNSLYCMINLLRTGIYRELKQYEKALESATRLQKYNPLDGHLNMAQIYQETKQYELALQHYRIAADMGEPYSCFNMFLYYFPILGNTNEAEFDDFNKFIHFSHTNKNKEKAIYYLKKAAEKGHLSAMFRLVQLYGDPKMGMVDYEEMVKWAILRNDKGLSYNDLEANNAFSWICGLVLYDGHYEIVDILKQHAAKEACANLLLSEIYRADEFPQKDSLISFEYIKKAAEMGSPICMAQMAYFLLNNKDTIACERICAKLIEKRLPYGLTMMGDIELERKHYKKAYEYYLQAHEMKYFGGSYGLAMLYLEGRGVPKDIDMAIVYADSATVYAKLDGGREKEISELWEKCNAARTDGNVVQETLTSPGTPDISCLLQITDTKTPADKRIALSEEIQGKLFASPKAVVKTVGANGNTIVATETAEDFMLRLSTSINISKIEVLKCITNEHGKITEITIKEE